MGLLKRKCGHEATHPFRVRCTKEAGHTGLHSAKGLRWSDNGVIKFGSRGGRR